MNKKNRLDKIKAVFCILLIVSSVTVIPAVTIVSAITIISAWS
jgi:hypothetical protein